jgi:hypothetical protein
LHSFVLPPKPEKVEQDAMIKVQVSSIAHLHTLFFVFITLSPTAERVSRHFTSLFAKRRISLFFSDSSLQIMTNYVTPDLRAF